MTSLKLAASAVALSLALSLCPIQTQAFSQGRIFCPVWFPWLCAH